MDAACLRVTVSVGFFSLLLWSGVHGSAAARCGPEGGLARVFAAQFSLSHACFLLTYPLAGWVGGLQPAPVLVRALLLTGGAPWRRWGCSVLAR
jgi:hypothetical protein